MTGATAEIRHRLAPFASALPRGCGFAVATAVAAAQRGVTPNLAAMKMDADISTSAIGKNTAIGRHAPRLRGRAGRVPAERPRPGPPAAAVTRSAARRLRSRTRL